MTEGPLSTCLRRFMRLELGDQQGTGWSFRLRLSSPERAPPVALRDREAQFRQRILVDYFA